MFTHRPINRIAVPFVKTACSLLVGAVISSPALAFDARSIALGGSVIANGHGVHGVVENPATLMRLKREQLKVHVMYAGTSDLRISEQLIDAAEDNENLASDIESEIDRISGQDITCNPVLTDRTQVCLTGTGQLGIEAGRVSEVFDDIDNNPVNGRGTSDLGLALTQTAIPVGIVIGGSVSLEGFTSIADGDRRYVQSFDDALSDGELTLEEIDNNANFIINEVNQTIELTQPEDVLQSSVSGSALVRGQIGLSFGMTLPVRGIDVDFGITPKLSILSASNLETSIADEFDDEAESFEDQFDNSKNDETSFTFDVGAVAQISNTPFRLAAVLRNVIPESIETNTGFEFETTPHLIVGGVWQSGMWSINADVALNEGKYDNFETQPISLGVEFGKRLLALRGGVSVDASRDEEKTALSLGAGLGPLQIGVRTSGEFTNSQLGLQLSHSF